MALTVPEPLPLPITARRFAMAVREKRARIAVFVLSVAVVSAGIALLLKPVYTASATILPPSESSDMFSNLAGLIESSALNRVGLFSTNTPSDIAVEVLKSRRLRESLIRKFDLERLYEVKGMDRALRQLDARLFVKPAPSGIVTVTVDDGDKQRCADMANFMVSELDRFNRETLNTKGKRTRQFLEERMSEEKERLIAAESTLTVYEQVHKVVLTADEAAGRGVADVAARKLSLQIRRAYVQSYSAPGSPEVREIDAELDAFDRELDRLPALKNEGTRVALEAQIHRKVWALLAAQYEQARVEEMRDTPTVTLLDQARPPEIRTKPKRSLIVFVSTMLAFVAAMGWVAFSLRRPTLA